MTDREMLELAAKAAGIEPVWAVCMKQTGEVSAGGGTIYRREWCIKTASRNWDPLSDDVDALRLAVNLGLSVTPYPIYNETDRHAVVVKQRRKTDLLREANPTEVVEQYGDDPLAATRRAIVRAAAQIGEKM